MHRFVIFAFETFLNLETRIRGHSGSLEMTPRDGSHMNLYSHFIVTLALACTVSGI